MQKNVDRLCDLVVIVAESSTLPQVETEILCVGSCCIRLRRFDSGVTRYRILLITEYMGTNTDGDTCQCYVMMEDSGVCVILKSLQPLITPSVSFCVVGCGISPPRNLLAP
jgi:hypothetical protein